jgi:hypothetical protein
MRYLRQFLVILALVAPSVAVIAAPAQAADGPLVSNGSVRLSALVNTVGPDGVNDPELPVSKEGDEGEEGEEPGSPASGPRIRAGRTSAAGAEVRLTFAGLNHRDNRLANGGNQFSSEPPDQALCVGPNHVLEGVNTVLRVFTKNGAPASPVISFNEFFGYPPAVNRTTGEFGAFITDPVCHFDAATGRYVLVVLTLDQDRTTGQFTGRNRLDIAVSSSSDPTGTWKRYALPVQNDGTEGTPDHNCDPDPDLPPEATNPSACLGDYPHIGADRYGIYITTNEYAFFGDGTHGGSAYTGSQIYAISKKQLAAGVDSPTLVNFNSPRLGAFRSFTVWPAISPAGQESRANRGTEYFLSSTLGDGSETGNTAPSENRIGLWALTGTSTLDAGTPALHLQNKLIKADTYALPPRATQKDGPAPLRDCLNDRGDTFGPGLGCWALFLAAQPPEREELSDLDSGDTRMQQVVYSDGMLWGSLGTAVSVGRKHAETRAGVLWVGVRPDFSRHGRLDGRVRRSGYVGLSGNDVTYPAVGVTASRKVIMTATLTGSDHYPSASYTVLTSGRPTVRVISEGKGPQDGFSGYTAFNDPPRPRWGDYSATAMDGNRLWVASETIEQRCTLQEYIGPPDLSQVGSCGGTRTALANWGTRVSALRF